MDHRLTQHTHRLNSSRIQYARILNLFISFQDNALSLSLLLLLLLLLTIECKLKAQHRRRFYFVYIFSLPFYWPLWYCWPIVNKCTRGYRNEFNLLLWKFICVITAWMVVGLPSFSEYWNDHRVKLPSTKGTSSIYYYILDSIVVVIKTKIST